jgi:hypothetical protein
MLKPWQVPSRAEWYRRWGLVRAFLHKRIPHHKFYEQINGDEASVPMAVYMERSDWTDIDRIQHRLVYRDPVWRQGPRRERFKCTSLNHN